MKRKVLHYDPCPGYALIVGGPRPYVSNVFVSKIGDSRARETVARECTEPYHHVKPAVVITLAEYRELRKLAR